MYFRIHDASTTHNCFHFISFTFRKGRHRGKKGKHNGTSAGPCVASYVPPRHKLQHNGFQLENVFAGRIGAVLSHACTGTELGLTSKDDSWVGEGHGRDGQTSIGLQGSDPVANPDSVNIKSQSSRRLQLNEQKRRRKKAKLAALSIEKTFVMDDKNNKMTSDNDNEITSNYFHETIAATLPTSQPSGSNMTTFDDVNNKASDDESTLTLDDFEDHMSATQPAVQPSGYIMRRKSKQRNRKDFIKPIPTTKTAKYDKSCIVHVINDDEMKTLTRQGVTFIHLKSPNRMDINDVEIINWELDSPSIDSLSEIDLLKLNVMIVTKYHDIKHDEKLSFIGTIPKRIPEDNDIILLALILQTELDDEQESIDVQSLCQRCDTTKWNINKGTSSNHFDSSGNSLGFGAR